MSEGTRHLRIGWASDSLVPDRPALLRGMPKARIGKEVHDPITVTALALAAQNGERAILVSADLCAIDDGTMAAARECFAEQTPDVDPRLLVVNATHTHTSLSGIPGIYPQPNEDCMTPAETVAFMGASIARTAAEAWANRKSGSIAWGRGQAVAGHNRRIAYRSGESKMYGETADPGFSHAEGYEDHGVDLLYTYDNEARLTVVVVNLACPAQCSQGMSSISADFWHEARLDIRGRLGEGLFVLPQCSAAGDQSPEPLLHKAAERRMLALREGLPPEMLDVSMARRREIGRRLAAAVEETLPLASLDVRENVPFVHRIAEIELPMLEISAAQNADAEAELAAAKRALEKHDPATDWQAYSAPYRQVYRYTRLIERYRAQREKRTQTVEIHVIRLGDIVLATNPFELFLDFGEQLKARSGALQTFVVQLAGNGSYVPTERAVTGKGYGAEPVSNPIGPDGGRVLVEETLKIIGSL